MPDTVEDAIGAAFAGVRLGDGTSLRQARAMDSRDPAFAGQAFRALRRDEVTEDWAAIPFEELDQDPAFPFLDAEGFRYYLPAFMLGVLARYEPCSMRVISTLSALYPRRDGSWSFHMGRYALLDDAQRAAVARFLTDLPDRKELYAGDRRLVERALRNYWHAYLP